MLPLVAVNSASAQPQPLEFKSSPALQALVDRAARETLAQFADRKLESNQLAITLVELRDSNHPVRASFRGDVQIYPASVIKLFYLVAAHQWMEDGKLADTEELRRAMQSMIVDSGNESTGYVVDLLTDTTSGPELSPDELERWYDKRNAVNRYFASLGYRDINVNRKPWYEGPYGREMQSTRAHPPNHRNWLTTDATARLLMEIVTGRSVTPERSRQMMALLRRELRAEDGAGQAVEFTGPALPDGAKLWSKAGWTSQTRHDAVYVELPNGGRFVLVTFTTDHARNKEIIPAVARIIVPGMTP